MLHQVVVLIYPRELVVLGIANREEFLRDDIKLHKRSPCDGMGTVMEETNKHVVGLDIGDRAIQDRVDDRSDIGNSGELADPPSSTKLGWVESNLASSSSIRDKIVSSRVERLLSGVYSHASGR